MYGRLSRWGVGPKVLVTALGYAIVAGAVTATWPRIFLIHGIPSALLVTLGLTLLALGVPMLVLAGRAATVAYNQDTLATTGIFGRVRNPIYSAWIVLIIPGLALLSRSWLVLATPLIAYAAFKLLIRKEDEYLTNRFGQAYLDYRARVNELIPIPRFGRRR